MFTTDLTADEAAFAIGVRLSDPLEKLGPIDKWRHKFCRTEAAKTPTELRVNDGLRVRRKKFLVDKVARWRQIVVQSQATGD